MRIPTFFLSVAALALAACDSSPLQSNGGGSQSGVSADVDERSLEQQVMAALDDAPRHGLTRDLFLKGDLPSGGAEKRDALLRIARDYASALANGKVDPGRIVEVYTVPRPKVDVTAALSQALSQNKFREWANSLAPQNAEYQALSLAFVQLVQRSPDLPDSQVPAGETIKPGDSDPRVPAIVANLTAQGYLAGTQPQQPQQQGAANEQAAQPGAGNRYTPEISKAVAQFQADTGRKADAVIGPSTVEALNSGPRDRARQLAVSMERLRWLERNPPATRIDVNTAATLLDYYRDGQRQDRRPVVTGQPGWETPQLGSPIFRLVANPTWTVPDSIVEDEISKKSGAWLRQNNFTRKNGRWVQEPGPENSLGEVKFDMKNDEAIYLHDTPAKALFGQPERHRSHGCVRVENALEFARMLAQADGVLDEFDKAMATGDETFVDLNNEIPVRLMYHTAFLDADGRVKFAQDVYGWDNGVAQALGYPTRQPAQVRRSSGSDVGP